MTRYEKYQRMTIDEAAELVSGIDKDGCTICKMIISKKDRERK